MTLLNTAFSQRKRRVQKKQLQRVAQDLMKRLRRGKDRHNRIEIEMHFGCWLTDTLERCP